VKIVVHERKEASEVHRSLSSCSSFRVISEIKLHYYQKKKKNQKSPTVLALGFPSTSGDLCTAVCGEQST
jgi:hypothetical protein